MSPTADAVRHAALLRESGRADESLKILGPYLASFPGDVEAHRQAGWSQLALDRIVDAHRSAERTLALAPTNPDSHLLMAGALAAQRRYPEARQAVAGAMTYAPHSGVPFQVAVSIDLRANEVTAGTESLSRRAIELDPHDPDGHRLLGSTLLKLKRFDEARAAFRQALALDPADQAAAGELARADLVQGRTGQAASGFVAALRSDPTNQIIGYNLRVAAFHAFGNAQLVLWIGFFIGARIRSLASSSSGATAVHTIIPIAVLLALAMWAYQLRRSSGGIAALVTAVRADRLLLTGVLLHFLCMPWLLIGDLLPYAVGQWVIVVGAVLLAGASIMTWVIRRQLRKTLPTR